MKITKAASVELSGAPSAEQLEKINRLTKKAVTAEEVYVFSVRLCDDQVDRDDERFSESCIRELAALFIGKTGVMDHVWSAEKQVARIFDTEVLAENGATYLKGWAYMLRGAETDGLIREIDGGIKKEVSIGCAVKRRMCSICGAEYGACEHVKGETYGAERCAAVLCEAVDAYEFSFVAVPAQNYRTGDLVAAAKAFADASFDLIEDENIKAIVESIRQDMTANIYQNLVDRGLTLWNAGNKTEAMDYFQASLTIKPDNPEALFYVGRLYQDAGDMDNANTMFDKVVNEFPDSPYVERARNARGY